MLNLTVKKERKKTKKTKTENSIRNKKRKVAESKNDWNWGISDQGSLPDPALHACGNNINDNIANKYNCKRFCDIFDVCLM